MPIVFRAILVQHQCRRRSADVEPFVNLVSYFISPCSSEKNKIGVQKILEFFVLKKLLIQQYTGPSAIREEVDQNQLVFDFSFGDSIVQASLKPILSDSKRG